MPVSLIVDLVVVGVLGHHMHLVAVAGPLS